MKNGRLAALWLLPMLLSLGCSPRIETRYVYVYPGKHLLAPTPTPKPWYGITCEDWPTVYAPMMERAIEECNADKKAIIQQQED
ncbi:Rz1-like lysis system protein LysC [Geoalkalibacter sp.]|uniref:Rz1-like lysis system protein LysC n=1 Tax=Geoalkalibacter sp. TaxID=3041440 RepID=UPI00272E8AB7|nr:hypothetical protein [Geoalkalibacter sp.]